MSISRSTFAYRHTQKQLRLLAIYPAHTHQIHQTTSHQLSHEGLKHKRNYRDCDTHNSCSTSFFPPLICTELFLSGRFPRRQC
ncbi:hypothetical protein K443DRAFT_513878 [Laccaria amethystina LaAM-08-1]|uniref:Uncharacterized protein n=1 Tax=Laccaria amethystina LaAM-08-1 TaxID=1095629 RepID=A0A0C9Y3B2_9AGAR|nr:hypothetical protein K443DRAFT_513878 [Laccaria amethystina LaAM-08-1]